MRTLFESPMLAFWLFVLAAAIGWIVNQISPRQLPPRVAVPIAIGLVVIGGVLAFILEDRSSDRPTSAKTPPVAASGGSSSGGTDNSVPDTGSEPSDAPVPSVQPTRRQAAARSAVESCESEKEVRRALDSLDEDSSAHAHLTKAIAAYHNGDLRTLEREARAAAASWPEQPPPVEVVGYRILGALGDGAPSERAEAYRLAKHYLAANPNSPWLLIEVASLTSDQAERRSALDRAAQQPGVNLSSLYWELATEPGESPRGLLDSLLARAAPVDRSARTWWTIAYLSGLAGDAGMALDSYERAVAIAPVGCTRDWSTLQLNLATKLVEDGSPAPDPARAVELADAALAKRHGEWRWGTDTAISVYRRAASQASLASPASASASASATVTVTEAEAQARRTKWLGRAEDVALDVTRTTSTDRDRAQAFAVLGDVRSESQQYRDAEVAYTTSLLLDPSRYWTRMSRGFNRVWKLESRTAAQIRRGIDDLRRAARDAVANKDAQASLFDYQVAIALLDQNTGDSADVAARYVEHGTVSPWYVSMKLGDLYRDERDDRGEAVRWYDTAIDLAATRTTEPIWRRLALTTDADLRVSLCARMAALFADSADAHACASTVARDAATSLVEADLAAERAPTWWYPHNERAWALLSLGRADEAVAAADEAVRLADEKYASGLQTAAIVRARTGVQLDEALAHARAAVKLSPTDVWSHRALAETLAAAGQTKKAIEEWRTCLELGGDPYTYSVLLARALSTEQRYAEALDAINAAIAADGRWSADYYSKGYYLEQTGAPRDQVSAAYAGGLERDPAPNAYYLAKGGRVADALASADAAVEAGAQDAVQSRAQVRWIVGDGAGVYADVVQLLDASATYADLGAYYGAWLMAAADASWHRLGDDLCARARLQAPTSTYVRDTCKVR